MSDWIKINDSVELKAILNGGEHNKKYRFEKKEDDDIIIISQSNLSPTECSKSSELHIFIKKLIKDDVAPNKLDDTITNIKNQLEQNIVDETAQQNNESILQDKEAQAKLDEKYTDLYSSIESSTNGGTV